MPTMLVLLSIVSSVNELFTLRMNLSFCHEGLATFGQRRVSLVDEYLVSSNEWTREEAIREDSSAF